ncbi:MAG TPA: tRNA pseudouridine(55) synthase TruB [Ignavibacteria bacterium]|nr:tRNA pseudouridine(55) synthase TruB [Ignavibacteria bacterium]
MSERFHNPELDNKIILVDKPLNRTSANVLNILRRQLGIKKLGHAGTLDPKATGLLIVCTGRMTKSINEFIDYDKEYTGIIRIGAVTECYDTEKEEKDFKDTSFVTDELLEDVRKKFVGEIKQMPPMHSAIKMNGKPLYKLARKGKEIERKPRDIFIENFLIKRLSETEVYFDITCSKGTYIRSIANDFGEALGTGGYLKELRRTRVGKFIMEDFPDAVEDIKYKILEAQA